MPAQGQVEAKEQTIPTMWFRTDNATRDRPIIRPRRSPGRLGSRTPTGLMPCLRHHFPQPVDPLSKPAGKRQAQCRPHIIKEILASHFVRIRVVRTARDTVAPCTETPRHDVEEFRGAGPRGVACTTIWPLGLGNPSQTNPGKSVSRIGLARQKGQGLACVLVGMILEEIRC